MTIIHSLNSPIHLLWKKVFTCILEWHIMITTLDENNNNKINWRREKYDLSDILDLCDCCSQLNVDHEPKGVAKVAIQWVLLCSWQVCVCDWAYFHIDRQCDDLKVKESGYIFFFMLHAPPTNQWMMFVVFDDDDDDDVHVRN